MVRKENSLAGLKIFHQLKTQPLIKIVNNCWDHNPKNIHEEKLKEDLIIKNYINVIFKEMLKTKMILIKFTIFRQLFLA